MTFPLKFPYFKARERTMIPLCKPCHLSSQCAFRSAPAPVHPATFNGRRNCVVSRVKRRQKERLMLRFVCANSGKYSDYSETSSAVKTIVSGMTAVANTLRQRMKKREEDVSSSLSSSPSSLKKLRNGNPARTVEMLERRIADEFRVKEYLWTGDIDVDLFSLKCVFTDPTLSFTGLETFRDNLESLQPSLRRIAPEGKRRVELRECGKDEDSADVVVAKWRMVGNLQLPWRPKIDIQGRNSISVSERESGRCGRRRRRAREKGWRRGGRERDVSPRGVLSRNVVRNGVRGALATRHAVRAREGVTFAKAKHIESSSSSSSSTRSRLCSRSCSIVVRANLPNILLSSGTSFCSSASLHFYSITKHAKHARTTCNHREKDSTTITTIPLLSLIHI